MCVNLENVRFYGFSSPTGDLTTQSLELLTSDQALADIQYTMKASLIVSMAPLIQNHLPSPSR